MLVDLPDKLVTKLRKLAGTTADADLDDFEVHAFCGSNVNDAYERGEEQGEIWLAREIVAHIKED